MVKTKPKQCEYCPTARYYWQALIKELNGDCVADLVAIERWEECHDYICDQCQARLKD